MQRYFAFLPKYVNLKNILLKIRRNFSPFIKKMPHRVVGHYDMQRKGTICEMQIIRFTCKYKISFWNLQKKQPLPTGRSCTPERGLAGNLLDSYFV